MNSGDFVAIEGRDASRTVGRVWPSKSSDAGRGLIRIDGQLRDAANVSIDERVSVEPTDVEPAERVDIALPQTLRISGDISSRQREHLVDQAVTSGQTIALSLGFGLISGRSGRRVPLQIVDTQPSGTVVVETDADLRIIYRSADEVTVDRVDTEETAPPGVTYEDVGGLDDELERVREMIELPIRPRTSSRRSASIPRGVLLHGPPGTGKTLIAKAVANELEAHFQTISGLEIMSKYYGESENSSGKCSRRPTRTHPRSSSSTNSTRSPRNARR